MLLLGKGENTALTGHRFSVRIDEPGGADICALMLDSSGQVTSDTDFVFFNQPRSDGVSLSAGGIDIDFDEIPAAISSIICAFSVDSGTPGLDIGPVPHAMVTDTSGMPLFGYNATGLTEERAVIVFEFYRRQPAWKLRAVGQGYRDGLAALATAHGVQVEADQASPPPEAAATGLAAQPTGNQPPGTSDPERQLRVLAGIFEDAARSAAGYRSAIGFAEQRRERELGDLLADPRLRNSTSTPVLIKADQRYADLVTRATADHRRDVDHLTRELRQLTPVLPAALAPWEEPVWRAGPFAESAGIRVGELFLPEAPDLLIPLVLGVPLHRPLWLLAGSGGVADGSRIGGAVGMARALIIRLLAADRSLRLQVCDTDGALISALGDLAAAAAGVLGGPVARTAQQRSESLTMLAERVDLIEMARSGNAMDALPVADNPALLVLTDVGVGFEPEDHSALRYLIEHGARSGVQVILLGDPVDAETAVPLARASLILQAGAAESISDGWVGLPWTFTADNGPSDPASIVFGR